MKIFGNKEDKEARAQLLGGEQKKYGKDEPKPLMAPQSKRTAANRYVEPFYSYQCNFFSFELPNNLRAPSVPLTIIREKKP